jgi:drug/metabolite transporter (DMT)-like permease
MSTPLIRILLLAFPFGLGAAQVLLKMAAQRIQPGAWIASMTDPLLFAAVGLYGLLGVIWLLILRELPLSIAYPFVAVSFAVTPVLAWTALGDRPQGLYFVGIAFICLGVAITQRAAYGA